MKFDKLTCPKCGSSIVTVYGFATAELNGDHGELIQSSFYWDDESDCRCNSCGHEDRVRDFEPPVAMYDLRRFDDETQAWLEQQPVADHLSLKARTGLTMALSGNGVDVAEPPVKR